MNQQEARPPAPDCGEPAPKRKKTVTWAGDVPASSAEGSDGPQSSAEEPAGPAASAAPAAGGGDGGGDGGAAVVVLPQEPDSLFQELEDLEGALEHQADVPAASCQPLSEERLLQRRIDNIDRLLALYEAEMWSLYGELHLRHHQFGAPPQPQQQQQQQQPQQQQQAGPPGEAAGAAGPPGGGEEQRTGHGSSTHAAEQAEGQPAADAQHGAAQQAEQPLDPRLLHRQLLEQARAAEVAEGGSEPAQPSSENQTPPGSPQAGAAAMEVDGEGGAQPQQAQQAQQANGAAAPAAQQEGGGGPKAAGAGAAPLPEPPGAAGTGAAAAADAGGAGQLPLFEEMEGAILALGPGSAPTPADKLWQQRAEFLQHLALIGRLEQSMLGALCRELDAHGALAVLCGRARRYLLRRTAVLLGRNTESQGRVDVDLSEEGPAAQTVSRQQAQLVLEPDGAFVLRCLGRRALFVNGQQVPQGGAAQLPHLSLLKCGGVSLLFLVNKAAVRRVARRSAAAAV